MDVKDLFDKHYEKIVNTLCYKHKCSMEDAKDAVQHAFICFLQKGTFFGEKPACVFLYKTAQNKLIDMFKKKKPRELSENIDISAPVISMEQVRHVDEYEYDNVSLQICISRLTPQQKQILSERYLFCRSYKEISRRLDITEDTVRMSLNRSRKNLKKCMGGENE